MTYARLTNYHAISTASTNATSVVAGSCQLMALLVSNSNAAARYVKFYDKATAPTVGTDVPVLTVLVPAGGTLVLPIANDGWWFYNGLALATTTGIADTDVAAVGANDLAISVSHT